MNKLKKGFTLIELMAPNEAGKLELKPFKFEVLPMVSLPLKMVLFK